MAFNIYKRGQGKYTRLGSSFGMLMIVGIGCFRLYQKLSEISIAVASNIQMLIATLIPAAVFVVLGLVIYWLVNKPVVADFMIAAEGEMKKVSWSNRKEIAVSTFIVIVVVLIVAVLLGVTDVIFSMFFKKILVG